MIAGPGRLGRKRRRAAGLREAVIFWALRAQVLILGFRGLGVRVVMLIWVLEYFNTFFWFWVPILGLTFLLLVSRDGGMRYPFLFLKGYIYRALVPSFPANQQ